MYPLLFLFALPAIILVLDPIMGWLDRRDARATLTKGVDR